MLDLDELRSLLGFSPVEGESWFHQTEQIVGFAPQKEGMRAVILRNWGTGPTAIVFPRSTANQRLVELVNPGHTHHGDFPECWLRQQAFVVITRPLPLAKDHLKQVDRLCIEEDAFTILGVMAASC